MTKNKLLYENPGDLWTYLETIIKSSKQKHKGRRRLLKKKKPREKAKNKKKMDLPGGRVGGREDEGYKGNVQMFWKVLLSRREF